MHAFAPSLDCVSLYGAGLVHVAGLIAGQWVGQYETNIQSQYNSLSSLPTHMNARAASILVTNRANKATVKYDRHLTVR